MIIGNHNLLCKSSNRTVYKVGDCVYKKAHNSLGLASNKTEIELSKKVSNMLPFEVVTHDHSIIKTKYISILNKKEDYKRIFGYSKKDLLYIVEYFYFKTNTTRYNNRLPEYKKIEFNNYSNTIKNININFNLKQLINITVKHNLEPADLLNSLHFDNETFYIYDAGLTEENYLNNCFRFVIIRDAVEFEIL
jgi:hypothetical protein